MKRTCQHIDSMAKSPLTPLSQRGKIKTGAQVKPVILILMLLCAIAAGYGLPKVKYTSPQILPKLAIPYIVSGWLGKDIAYQLNPDEQGNNFIAGIFARAYMNQYGEQLLFLILDAGNFHNPQVCLGSAGWTVKELPGLQLKVIGRGLQAHALYAQKGDEGQLLIYWICIDKKVVDWTEQKIKQLWYSLFNKEKVGLMARLDIPAREETLDSALKLAREFLLDISSRIPPEQAEYIFGQGNSSLCPEAEW